MNTLLLLLNRFAAREGHTVVPQDYIEDGYPLGREVADVRTAFAAGRLPPDDAARLAQLPGWSWGPQRNKTAETLAALWSYRSRHGDVSPPRGHRENGVALASRITQARRAFQDGTIDPELQRGLTDLGVDLNPRSRGWQQSFQQLAAAVNTFGQAAYSDGFVDKDGNRVGRWATVQRYRQRRGELDAAKVMMLEALPGWSKRVELSGSKQWRRMFNALAGELSRHGEGALRYGHLSDDGLEVGRWACQQRSRHRARELRPEQVRALAQLPHWSWGYRQPQWENRTLRPTGG